MKSLIKNILVNFVIVLIALMLYINEKVLILKLKIMTFKSVIKTMLVAFVIALIIFMVWANKTVKISFPIEVTYVNGDKDTLFLNHDVYRDGKFEDARLENGCILTYYVSSNICGVRSFRYLRK